MRSLVLINLESVSEEEAALYKTRNAARAIVLDADRNVALLHATNNHYYKLPGGGIEEGEDQITALKRECKEEIGCEIEVMSELGSIVEYRKKFNLKQISYCYFARLVGEKGKPELTESEIEEGFVQIWLPLEEAYKIVSESKPTIYEGPYMVARDAAFLKVAYEKSVAAFPKNIAVRIPPQTAG